MFLTFNQDFKRDLKRLKHKYLLIKCKTFLCFILPVFALILSLKLAREFIKINVQKIARNQLH